MKRDYFRTNRAIASGDKSKAQRYWEYRSMLERRENVHVENLEESRLHVEASPPKRKKPSIEDFLYAETQKLIAEDPDFTSCSSSGEDDVLDLDTPVTSYAGAAGAGFARNPFFWTVWSFSFGFFSSLKKHSDYFKFFCYILFGL